MQVGIPAETLPGERRVALVPEIAPRITALGANAVLQTGAGAGSLLDDEAYAAAGVELADRPVVLGSSEMVCKVQPPTLEEVGLLSEGAGIVSFLQPAADLQLVQRARDPEGHVVQPGSSATHQPRSVHGRPVLAGTRVRLSRGTARGRASSEVLPALHDRGRHDPAGKGARARRRRRRPAGHRDRRAGSARSCAPTTYDRPLATK